MTPIVSICGRGREALFGILILLVSCSADFPPTSPEPNPPARENNPSQNRPTILFFGDSLTAGHGIDPSLAFPDLIQEKIIQEGWNFRTINAGVSGDTSAGGLRRISWVLNQRIDVLVLELGANDALRGTPLEATQQNLQAIVDRVREHSPRFELIVAGMMMPPNLGLAYTRKFRDIFPELVEKNDGHLIPFLLEGVAARPEFNLPDGIHPNPKGHKIVAETVWRVLRPVLAQMQ